MTMQHVITLLAELLVVRRQVHLLPMRLQVRVVQDSPGRSTIAGVDSLGANVATEQRCGPMRHGDADVLRRPASLSLDAGCIGVGEKSAALSEERPSASAKAGLSLLANRAFPTRHGTDVHPEGEPRNVTRTNTLGHQQQGLGLFSTSRFGLRRANGRFHLCALLRRKRKRRRPRTWVGAGHPRLSVDHAVHLPEPATSGQISAERY